MSKIENEGHAKLKWKSKIEKRCVNGYSVQRMTYCVYLVVYTISP